MRIRILVTMARPALTLFIIVALCPFIWGFSGHGADDKRQLLGHVKPKHSIEIQNSPWGIQAGTLDEEIIAKAAEIGVKWTRLQATWPEIERSPGVYIWDETDKAFSTAIKMGITPFVTIGGSNGLYTAWNTNVDPKLTEIYGKHRLPPTSNPQAMSAWLKFVEQVVLRYKGTIKYWEIWNEPNHFAYWGDEPNGKEYGQLLNESAKVVKRVDPQVFVIAGALAGLDPEYTDAFLSMDNRSLVDIITFHNYGSIPEERIYKALQTWDVINRYNPAIKLWQGECGYPSHSSTRDYRGSSPWGPTVQAKWLLRQAFTDTYFCRASMSNYFKLFHGGGRGVVPKRSFLTSVDSVLGFPERAGARVKVVGVNEKCLLENPTLEPKPGFAAYQNLCALIDDRYKPFGIKNKVLVQDEGVFYGIGSEDDAFPSIPLVASYRTEKGRSLVAYWLPWHPQEMIRSATVRIEFKGLAIIDPVLVDPLDGKVYSLAQPLNENGTMIFDRIPLTDYPLIIAERSEVEIIPAQ